MRKNIIIAVLIFGIIGLLDFGGYFRHLSVSEQIKAQVTNIPKVEITQHELPIVESTPSAEVSSSTKVKITYYGWNDNDPPGNGIAFPHTNYPNALHNVAEGEGTFEDPITFAAKLSEWPIGTVVYAPYIKKYLILEDICAGCSHSHIDIWMMSNGDFPKNLNHCQGSYTREIEVVEFNPPSNRMVNLVPLFNPKTGKCLD